MPADPDNSAPGEDPVELAAAAWLARRERGLTPDEQDGYLQWLREDAAHGRAMARLDETWRALDALGERHALRGTRPNPDLLMPRAARANPFRRVIALALALAAAIALFVLVRERPTPAATPVATARHDGVRVSAPPERITLADGSIVVLHGGRVEPVFTASERRIRLLRGEAHFIVTKNPARPFIVDTGHVAVRAVGTAFDVVHSDGSVAVLVTEGRVQVQCTTAGSSPPGGEPTPVTAGERAVVDTTAPELKPVVTSLAPVEIDRALAWQSVRLEFADLPLSEVVAEFNLRNSRQLVFGDADAPKLLVAGTFRADNVDAFVRLLEQSFGVSAERREDGAVVLRLAK